MRTLPAGFRAYDWAPSTEELARRAGLDPVEIVRFDGNVPPLPLPTSRPATVAAALATVNEYPRGLYPVLTRASAPAIAPGRDDGSGHDGVFWSNRITCETSIPARRATSSFGGAQV